MLTEPAQFVEDSPGKQVVVVCKAGTEDVQTTGGEAPKDPAEEEAGRRIAYEIAVARAAVEEKARSSACSAAALQENNARRKAYEEAMKRTAEEEAARRGVPAATLIASLPKVGKKKKGGF